MFNTTGHAFIAGKLKQALHALKIYPHTLLNTVTELQTNRYITWVSETDVADHTVIYELFNGEYTATNAKNGMKGFRITIIRNDLGRGRAEIFYAPVSNKPGIGLDMSIMGATDIEFMHDWHTNLLPFIATLESKLIAVSADALKFSYDEQTLSA